MTGDASSLPVVASPFAAAGPGRAGRAWRAFRRFPVFPSLVLGVVVVVGVLTPWIQPHDPEAPNLLHSLQPPAWAGGDWAYPLGTDELGRDTLSRLMSGARVSLLVGLSVVLGAGAIGLALALVAGYFGGIIDAVISRVTEMFIAVPFLLVAIAVVGSVGASLQNLILTLMFMSWAGYARVLRSEVLKVREQEYVKLARVAGCSNLRIIVSHILPNLINVFVVLATLQLGSIIIAEASLSYLGLGVPPPRSSWGGMLAGGKDFIGSHDALTLAPGISIALTCLSINLLGDWLRVRLDPRFRQV